jgi:hypothetical protein
MRISHITIESVDVTSRDSQGKQFIERGIFAHFEHEINGIPIDGKIEVTEEMTGIIKLLKGKILDAISKQNT